MSVKNLKHFLVLGLSLVFLATFLTSCGSSGGGGSTTSSSTTNVSGQATLGPLSGASIVLTDLSGRVIATTTAKSDNSSLSVAGSFSFSVKNSELPNVFLLKACGGRDIDPSDNSTAGNGVTNNGCIHAILTSDDLYARKIEINPLTEMIYQDALNIYGANLSSVSESNLKTFLNQEAQLYLQNSGTTYNDILDFNPIKDKSKSKISWGKILSLLVSGIHNGESSGIISQRVRVLKSYLKKTGIYIGDDNESIEQIKDDSKDERFITFATKANDNSSIGSLHQILVTNSGETINIYVSKINDTYSYLDATITKQGHTLSMEGKTTLLQGLSFDTNTIANFVEPLIQITSDNSSSVEIKIDKKLAERISSNELIFKIDGRKPSPDELKTLVDDPIIIWDTKETEELGEKYGEYSFLKNGHPFTLYIEPGTGVAVLEVDESYYNHLMGIINYSSKINFNEIKDTALTFLGIFKDDTVAAGVEESVDKLDLLGLDALSKFTGILAVLDDLKFLLSGGIPKTAIKLGGAHLITLLMGTQNTTDATVYENKPYYPIIFYKPQGLKPGTIYLNIKEFQALRFINHQHNSSINNTMINILKPFYYLETGITEPLVKEIIQEAYKKLTDTPIPGKEITKTIPLCDIKPKLHKVYIIFPGKFIFKKEFKDSIIHIEGKPVAEIVTKIKLTSTKGLLSGIIRLSSIYTLKSNKTIYTNFTYSVKNNQLYLDASSSIAPNGSIESYVWKNSAGETIATGETASVSFSDLIVKDGLASITLETRSGSYTGERTKVISLCGQGEVYENGTCVSNLPGLTILSEDFSHGFSNWALFGSPSPKIVDSFKGYSYVFDNNGDSWCDSGIFSKKSFNLQPGLEIDADMYFEVDNYNGCFNTIRVALTNGVPQTSGNCVGESYYYYNLFIFNMEGEECWADSSSLYGHSYIQLPPDYNRILGDKYVNGWHHLRIAINNDYTETVYIDGTKIGTSSSPIPEDYRNNVMLMLAGRSLKNGGENYMDNIVVKVVK